jgi:UPF0755 protein
MTIRRGGRARDDRSQAHPLGSTEYADPVWTEAERVAARTGRYEARNGRRANGHHGPWRFLLFALVLGAFVIVVVVGTGLTILRPLVRSAVVDWAWDNPSMLGIGVVDDLVREDLGESLDEPASGDPATVEFAVESGDTPEALAPRLAAEGLIGSERSFLYHAHDQDLGPQLEEGRFALSGDMTPAEIVTGLIENRIRTTTTDVTFREGLRLEQMTALLQTIDSQVDPEEFLQLALEPSSELREDYPWLEEGRSLEGYLYPARYTLVTSSDSDTEPVTDAEGLIRMLLDKFEETVGEERIAVAEERGLTFYEVLTLASIVEREAQVPEERPLIAGVYENRLDSDGAGQILAADPVVLYALDSVALADTPFEQWQEYFFWKTAGRPLSDVELPEDLAGYQSYRTRGLPPGPIVSPTVESIDAALEPDTDDGYLYFLAIPGEEGGGKHVFSKTEAEHDRYRREYGYL